MFGLRKKTYVLIDLDVKEDVLETKEFISKEAIKEDIENEVLPESSYRLVEKQIGKKDRTVWTYRQKKTKSPEDIAEKNREEAEKFLQSDAVDIQERVAKHKEFRTKIVKMYGIENVPSEVDKIEMPEGKLGIVEAIQLATAQSMYQGIRERPSEMCDNFFNMMDSGTKILNGVAEMFAKRLAEPKKKVLNNKVKAKPEEAIKVKKEKTEEGITRISFGKKEEEVVSDITEPEKEEKSYTVPELTTDVVPDIIMYEDYERYFNRNKEEEEKEKEDGSE